MGPTVPLLGHTGTKELYNIEEFTPQLYKPYRAYTVDGFIQLRGELF